MVCWLCDELSVCVTLVWMRETGGAAALSHGQVHLSVSNHDLLFTSQRTTFSCQRQTVFEVWWLC